ncbi:hypothetical protein ALC62_05888, partial [Cyphomyrmex costatus]
IASSARIQITSSNATLATQSHLPGAVLYVKRSCNPALADVAYACDVTIYTYTRCAAYNAYMCVCVRVRQHVSLSNTPIHCRKSTNLQPYWLSSEDCSFLFLTNRRIELSDTDGSFLLCGHNGDDDILSSSTRISQTISQTINMKLVALNFVDETRRENGKVQTTEDEEELYSLTKVRKGVLCCRKWGELHASSGLDTALPVCSSITWPSLRISDTLQKYETLLPADSEVCHECHRHHSLRAIRLFYAVAKNLHVLIFWSRHVLQVHGPAFETRRSRIRSGDVQRRVSRMKRIGSAEVQSVPGQSAV